MSATEIPLVTPDAIISRLTLELAGMEMREQIAKEANDKMRAQLATAEAEKLRLLGQIATMTDEREAAESRVEELTDEHTELAGKLDMAWHRGEKAEARLAAVLRAADAMRTRCTKLAGVLGCHEIEAYDAARTGDLHYSISQVRGGSDAPHTYSARTGDAAPALAPAPGSPLWNILAEVEAAHFRTEHDTGAAEQARLVWNALRRRLGLPWLDKQHLPKWDGKKYAMPADSTLLANTKLRNAGGGDASPSL